MVERPSALQSRAKVRRLRSQTSASHPRHTAHVRNHRSQARPASDPCPQCAPRAYGQPLAGLCRVEHSCVPSWVDAPARCEYPHHLRLEFVRLQRVCLEEPLRERWGRYCVWTGAHMQDHPLQKWPVCGRVRAIPELGWPSNSSSSG